MRIFNDPSVENPFGNFNQKPGDDKDYEKNKNLVNSEGYLISLDYFKINEFFK